MLYILLKPLMRLAVWLYFGNVHREGLAHIDNGRPSLIVANHTASFMDAVITAVYVRRRIWFFTRGDVFRGRLVAWLLRGLGMLPVYRMRDGKDRLQENEASNDAALRILKKGGAVLIFAEGESRVDKMLKPLKKGPFRLAIRAAALVDPVPVIVPLGINYVRPSNAFGDAWLVASEPYEIPAGDDETATRRATELMRKSAQQLEKLSWHVEYPGFRPIADFMLDHFDDIHPNARFRETLRLTQTFNNLNYRSAEALMKDWEEFRIWQRYKPLPPNLFLRPGKLREYVLAILGFPLAVFGMLMFMMPASLALTITRAKVNEPDFKAPVFLCLSVVFHLVWIGIFVGIYAWEGFPPHMLFWVIGMPLCEIFFLKLWLPAYRHVNAPLARRMYRNENQSHRLVFRLYEVLMQIGWMMLQGEPGADSDSREA